MFVKLVFVLLLLLASRQIESQNDCGSAWWGEDSQCAGKFMDMNCKVGSLAGYCITASPSFARFPTCYCMVAGRCANMDDAVVGQVCLPKERPYMIGVITANAVIGETLNCSCSLCYDPKTKLQCYGFPC